MITTKDFFLFVLKTFTYLLAVTKFVGRKEADRVGS